MILINLTSYNNEFIKKLIKGISSKEVIKHDKITFRYLESEVTFDKTKEEIKTSIIKTPRELTFFIKKATEDSYNLTEQEIITQEYMNNITSIRSIIVEDFLDF